MKTVSTAIAETLAAERMKTCDLYTLKLANGATFRYADFDKDVTYNGVTYTHGVLAFKSGQIKLQGAPTVDTLSVNVYCTPEDKIGNVPFLKACHSGMLAGSLLTLSKAYFHDSECIGILPVFSGKCEVVSAGGLSASLNVKSVIQGLSAPLPVRIFASQAAYTNVNGTVTVSSSDTTSMVIPLKPSGNVLLRL